MSDRKEKKATLEEKIIDTKVDREVIGEAEVVILIDKIIKDKNIIIKGKSIRGGVYQ